MKHALIIGNDDAAGRAIEDRLVAIGFRSCERAWSEDAAVSAAQWRRPDLVVIAGEAAAGSSFDAARRICALQEVPVLVAAKPGTVGRPPADASLTGPFALAQMTEALREAAPRPAELAA